MLEVPHPSAGRRFLSTLGFSLVQAILFGGAIALLMSLRAPHAVEHDAAGPQPLHRRLRGALDRLELPTYDWRARALGRASSRPDDVVVVAIDDDSLAAARNDADAALGAYPWPRQTLGAIAGRVLAEGARMVAFAQPFPDLSPRTCVDGCPGGPDPTADDLAFREALDRYPDQTLLAFSPGGELSRLGTTPRPHLLLVERHESELEARETVRRIFAVRRPAYVVPDGNAVQVWAGAASEEDARQIAAALEVRSGPEIRDLGASDRAFEVTPLDLLVALSEVQVEGLDPQRLPRARSLLHPVAPLLGTKSAYGAFPPPPDADGVVRGYPHLLRYSPRQGELHILPSAPLAVAMRLSGTRTLRYQQGRLWVGDQLAIPMDESGYSLIRWDAAPEAVRDARGTLKRDLSAWRLVVNLRDRANGLPPRLRNELDGRVAVIADTTSYSAAFSSTAVGKQLPDGAIAAQALANLLHSDGIRRSTPRLDATLVLAMAFLGAFLALTFAGSIRSRLGGVAYVSLLGGAALAYVLLARLIFIDDRLWIPIAGPMLAMGLTVLATTRYALQMERRIRDFVYALLGRSISPDVARQVSRDLSLTRPERRQATIAFCDIEGFTRLSVQLTPERLAQLANEFLTEMTAVVSGHGGKVEYTGDTLMAFWGAPLRTDRHAHQGCESMLLMRDALGRRQKSWTERFGHAVEFRAGLNSGEVVAGDMGSELKANYTVLGDPVILASRLERASRELGTWILVGETTAQLAGDAYVFRVVDRRHAGDKGSLWTVHELVGRKGELDEAQRKLLALHADALAAYHRRAFAEALGMFTRIRDELGDPVAEVYAARCKQLLDSPPPEEWDGVFDRIAA